MNKPKDNTDEKKQDTSAESAKPERSSTKKGAMPGTNGNRSQRMLWIGAASFVGVVILAIILIAVGFYSFNWQSGFTRSIVDTLGVPVAIFNTTPISHRDYQQDMDTLDFFYQAQAGENPGVLATPSTTYLEKSVLSRMIRERYTAQLAEHYGVTVSQDEVNNEYDQVVAQATSEDEVTQTLSQLYDWTPDQFKEKVLEPYVLRTKLAEKLATDDTLNADIKAEAQSVLDKIKSGELSFEDAAQQYSDDVTASSGGDLGYFSEGQMVTEFEDAVKNMEVGDISDLVQTQYGYHIIKLTEKVDATDDTPVQYRASHILFQTTDLDTYVNEQLADAYIAIFPKGLEWKDDCGLVLGVDETCDQNELLDTATSQLDTTTEPTDTTDTTDDTNTDTSDTNQSAE